MSRMRCDNLRQREFRFRNVNVCKKFVLQDMNRASKAQPFKNKVDDYTEPMFFILWAQVKVKAAWQIRDNEGTNTSFA